MRFLFWVSLQILFGHRFQRSFSIEHLVAGVVPLAASLNLFKNCWRDWILFQRLQLSGSGNMQAKRNHNRL
jgi:hypothetical protein